MGRLRLNTTYVSFDMKFPSNRKKIKDDKPSNHLSDCQEKCSVSMTELMKQGKLVLGEVTFPEHTSHTLQKELSSLLFSSAADTSLLCNMFQLKTSKDFFVCLVGFCVFAFFFF